METDRCRPGRPQAVRTRGVRQPAMPVRTRMFMGSDHGPCRWRPARSGRQIVSTAMMSMASCRRAVTVPGRTGRTSRRCARNATWTILPCAQRWRHPQLSSPATEMSVHGQAVKHGNDDAATCTDCHGGHEMDEGSNPLSLVARKNVASTCVSAISTSLPSTRRASHGMAVANGVNDPRRAPTVTGSTIFYPPRTRAPRLRPRTSPARSVRHAMRR